MQRGPSGLRHRKSNSSRGIRARGVLLLASLSWLGAMILPQQAEGQETRSFLIASAPLQVDVNSPIGWSFSFDLMAGDLDMISIHQDFFGIPWLELSTGAALPASWVAFQRDIQARAAATGLPIYLSLTPMSSDRISLSPYVKEEGDFFRLVERWSESCFDFANDPIAPDVRRSYLTFVDRMIELFDPDYLTSVIEINEFFFSCPAERWNAFVQFANEVYVHVKTGWPDLVTFPTFLMDPYWVFAHQDCPDDPVPCLDASIEPLRSLDGDRFGISTYPLVELAAIGEIPPGLITQVDPLVDAPIVIAETGFNSADVVISGPPLIGSCRVVLPSSDLNQATYMQRLFSDADSLDIDLVTWWAFRDYLPRDVGGCPCPLGQFEICLLLSILKPFEQALFRSFGHMGVLYNEGGEKPVHALWQDWRARSVRP